MLFLGCKALCIVLYSLIFWSICLCNSLLHFKNDPDYLTRKNTRMFIPLIRVLQQSLVLTSFLVLLRYSFLIFSFISTCLMMSAFNITHTYEFHLSLLIHFPVLSKCSPWRPSDATFFQYANNSFDNLVAFQLAFRLTKSSHFQNWLCS